MAVEGLITNAINSYSKPEGRQFESDRRNTILSLAACLCSGAR
jgi:hypothetical protein